MKLSREQASPAREREIRQRGEEATRAFLIMDILMGLTTEDVNGKIIPGAAESWTVSDDGLIWTFKMRQGALWSDGTPVTSDDFVYSWKRLLAPDTSNFRSLSSGL